MKIVKLLILTILAISFSLSFTFANRINILDIQDRDFGINEKTINTKLEALQSKYALNIDIAVLGEDKENCYLDYSFLSCIQNNYNYVGDMLFTVKKKLSESDNGDLEAFIESDFYFLIDTYTLKEIQDKAIPFFKTEELDAGIRAYLVELDNQLALSCDTIYNSYDASFEAMPEDMKSDKLEKSCNVFDLETMYYSTLALDEDIANQKSKETTKKIIIYIIVGIVTIFGLYFLYTKYQTSRYTNKLKFMLKDIKFYKIELENKDSFFPDAKKELNDDILSIEDKIERYLGDMDKNRKLLKAEYELFAIEKDELSKKREKAIYDYTHQDELKEKIEEFKKRDL